MQTEKKAYNNKKKLTRKDYERIIGIAKGGVKKRPSRNKGKRGGQRGGITMPDILLAKMISNDNKNKLQREAIIDTMNESQMKRMSKMVKLFLESRTELPPKTINMLSANQEFVKAIVKNKVPIAMKKKIFKQKEGILPMLLPFAAKVALPLAGLILSGIAGKIVFCLNGFQRNFTYFK